MNISKLKYVLRVCQTQNVTKAAEEMFISQQAVSRAVQSVEQELGVALFIRTAQGMAVTEAGREFYEVFQPLVRQFDEVQERFVRKYNPSAPCQINLGISAGVLRRFGITILDDFRREHPDVQLNVMESEDDVNIEYVLSGAYDMALCPPPSGYDDRLLQYLPVYSELFYLLMSKDHALAGKGEIHVQDLKHTKHLRLSGKDFIFRVLSFACQKAGFRPDVIYSSIDMELLKEMVVSANDIAFFCPGLYLRRLPAGAVAVPVNDPDLIMKEGFLFRRDKPLTSQCQELIGFVEDALARR